MAISPNPRFQALNPDTGALGTGYKLSSYLAGTSTPSSTYSDQARLVANANPLILDGSGSGVVWLDPAIAYKLVLKDSSDVVIWTLDGVNTAEPVNATTGTFSGAVTAASVTVTGQLTSSVVTGTAPLVVASTTNVPNLNASSLNGATMAAPGAIGGGTPNTIAGTAISGSSIAVTGAASSATNVVSGADGVTINGKIVPVIWSEAFYLFGTMVDAHMWIATRACKVRSVKEIHSVVGGAAATVRPRKITDTSAPGAVASATVKEITTASFDLTAIVNTTVTGTLSATASDYTFATGDKLSLDMSGTVAGTVGIIVVEFEAV